MKIATMILATVMISAPIAMARAHEAGSAGRSSERQDGFEGGGGFRGRAEVRDDEAFRERRGRDFERRERHGDEPRRFGGRGGDRHELDGGRRAEQNARRDGFDNARGSRDSHRLDPEYGATLDDR